MCNGYEVMGEVYGRTYFTSVLSESKLKAKDELSIYIYMLANKNSLSVWQHVISFLYRDDTRGVGRGF